MIELMRIELDLDLTLTPSGVTVGVCRILTPKKNMGVSVSVGFSEPQNLGVSVGRSRHQKNWVWVSNFDTAKSSLISLNLNVCVYLTLMVM